MPSTGSRRHLGLHPMAVSWLQPLPAATRAASRSPRLHIAPPPPPAAPPWPHRQPSPRASRQKYARPCLAPAPTGTPTSAWGWVCGCGLYPPPSAQSAVPTALTRAPP
eukprot:scaffold14534_cov105-Isochrysis_galbana.AAC.1